MSGEDQPAEPLEERPAEEPGVGPAGGRPAEPAAPEIPERSVTEIKKPSTLGGILYLCVLAVALFGVGVAASGAWQAGVIWLGGALLAGATARLVLPTEDAGMLEVRRKWVDAGFLILMGALLIFLAVTIPDQPV